MKNKIKNIELLSPAGSMESLLAAQNSGCNAIYLGGKDFSARSSAANFTIEEIKEACLSNKARKVKTYITINTLIKDSEFSHLDKYIDQLCDIGVDAIITQDFGVARFINNYYKGLRIHGSTQMTIHNLEGVLLLEKMGYERVVLSRELALTEIEHITNNTNVEIESFIHGALCYCYSGQCLMSSFIGGRSGNRGRCAQPCRLPYDVLKNGSTLTHVEGKYLLSPKDIQTLDIIPQLIESGIHSFKIEGRMKKPEYVAGVTRIYRKYIDMYLNNPSSYKVDTDDIKVLQQLFNRGGFTSGYYNNKAKVNMIAAEKPKNWGLKVGNVLSYNYKTHECDVKLMEPLRKGDGIEIWNSSGTSCGLNINKDYEKNKRVSLKIKEKVNNGDNVYKTKDNTLMKIIKQQYTKNGVKTKTDAFVKLKVGQPSIIKLVNGIHTASVQGDIVVIADQNVVLAERIITQIKKTGATPFFIENIELDMDDNIFIPISKLNELRRSAFEKLQNVIIKDKKVITKVPYKPLAKVEKYITEKSLSVLVNNIEYYSKLTSLNFDRIYFDLDQNYDLKLNRINKVIDAYKANNKEVFVALPYINKGNNIDKVKNIIENVENSNIDGYLIRNYEQVYLLSESKKIKVLDYTLNIFNSHTINSWENEGINNFTLSAELNGAEIEEVEPGNAKLELVSYGYLPLMISEQCIGKNNTGICSKDTDSYYIKDRLGNDFEVKKNCEFCNNKIYNCKPLMLLSKNINLVDMPTQLYRLQFTNESLKQIEDVVEAYNNMINLDNKRYDFNPIIDRYYGEGFTRGHFNRGVE